MNTSRLRRAATVFLSSVTIGTYLGLAPVAASAETPACAAAQLSLNVDGVGAAPFIGMSHSGAFAIVTNTSSAACEFSPLAALSMRAADGTTVAAGAVAGARFMHPGPVVRPLELLAGAMAATRLRWVDGDVYGAGRGVRAQAAALVLSLPDGSLVRAIPSTTLWGDTTPVTFERERFTTALEPLGAPAMPAPGTYVGAGPAGTTPVFAGATPRRLVLRRGTAGMLDFKLDELSVASPNAAISGSLVASDTTHATYATDDCRLDFAFYGAQLTIAQSGRCGLGNASEATATGRYHVAY